MFTLDDVFPIERINDLSIFFFILDSFVFVFMSRILYKKFGVFSFSFLWMFLFFFLGVLSQFFFAFSYLNVYASAAIYLYSKDTNITFLICSFGFISFSFGVLLSKKISFKPAFYDFVYKGTLGLYNEKLFIILVAVVLFTAVPMYLYLGVGFGDSRDFSMMNPALRPIINFYGAALKLLMMLSIMYLFVRKGRVYIITSFALIAFSFWSGTRGAVLFPLIFSIAMNSIYFKNKKVGKYILYALLVLSLVVGIQYFRDSESSRINFQYLFLYFFFGNSFSDLRDFTWVYYYWDGNYLYGKTIVSGMMAFIPSFISDFRETWNLGRWTTTITGLDPTVHPGLRPSVFGEFFFNFGYIGVFIMSLFQGLYVGRMDFTFSKIRKVGGIDRISEMLYLVSGFVYFSLITTFMLSPSYFSDYVTTFFLIIGVVFYKDKFKIKI